MNIKNLSKHNFFIIALFYTLGITYISLIPLQQYHLPNFNFADKIVHFFMYFFLAILWLFAYPDLWKIKKSYFLLLVIWGVIIEILQEKMVLGRSGDIFDALFNSMGAFTGMWVYRRFIFKKFS